jgi:hypothetical protein
MYGIAIARPFDSRLKGAPVDFYERLDEIGRDDMERALARDYFAWAESFASWLIRAARWELADPGRALGPYAP